MRPRTRFAPFSSDETPNDDDAHVVLMCGVAGSGKTTYARSLEQRGYHRLSIDHEVWSRFGRYGIDYAESDYGTHSAAAEKVLRQRLVDLVTAGANVVVDFSFWARADRERYKRLVEAVGGHWELVYLSVSTDRAELLRRLGARANRRDADAAFPISAERLDAYLAGFEPPVDEGETVIGPSQSDAGSAPRRADLEVR